jgi:mannose-6-phosphate isomerase-like protein (cupin superfamily)
MAEYTLVNLKEVEDRAPQFGLAPDLEARFAGEPLGLEQSGISYQRFAPNHRFPYGHRHDRQEEVYLLVGGSARLKLDDELVDLKQWDAVRISAETMRGIEAGPEGCELVAFGAPHAGPPPGDVTAMTPGWWAD